MLNAASKLIHDVPQGLRCITALKTADNGVTGPIFNRYHVSHRQVCFKNRRKIQPVANLLSSLTIIGQTSIQHSDDKD